LNTFDKKQTIESSNINLSLKILALIELKVIDIS